MNHAEYGLLAGLFIAGLDIQKRHAAVQTIQNRLTDLLIAGRNNDQLDLLFPREKGLVDHGRCEDDDHNAVEDSVPTAPQDLDSQNQNIKPHHGIPHRNAFELL